MGILWNGDTTSIDMRAVQQFPEIIVQDKIEPNNGDNSLFIHSIPQFSPVLSSKPDYLLRKSRYIATFIILKTGYWHVC